MAGQRHLHLLDRGGDSPPKTRCSLPILEPDLVFGRTPEIPFAPATAADRAARAWKATKLKPIGLHEARHTYASYLIAAGVEMKAISTYMGHSSVAFTYDRYGHLLPDAMAENTAKLDAYLARYRAHSGAHEA